MARRRRWRHRAPCPAVAMVGQPSVSSRRDASPGRPASAASCAVKHSSVAAWEETSTTGLAPNRSRRPRAAAVARRQRGERAVQRLLEEVEVADDGEGRRARDAPATVAIGWWSLVG